MLSRLVITFLPRSKRLLISWLQSPSAVIFGAPQNKLDKLDQTRQDVKKQRQYFANSGPSSQSYGFPVVMYGCESWTIKTAEHLIIDAFELCCWRRPLRFPWTARRSNQSILKEIIPEYSLEGVMLKLKLQYFGHLMGRTDSFEKTVMLGRTEGERKWGWQWIRGLHGITDSTDFSLSKLWDFRMQMEAWHATVLGVAKNLTQVSDWTELSLDSCSDSQSFLVMHALFSQDENQQEEFWEVVGHVVSPFDLSWTRLIGSGLFCVPYQDLQS